MNRFRIGWAVAAAAGALATAAIAQPPGGFGGGFGRGGGMFGGGISLLADPLVQKELKLTPEQVEKAKAKGPEVGQAVRKIFEDAGGFQALRDLSEEDRTKLFEKVAGVQADAVSSILTSDQKPRFHQLELQRAGSQALSRKDVVEALKITDEQKAKLQAIQTETRQARMQLFQSGGNPQDMTEDERLAFRKKMESLGKDETTKSFAVLTADQAKQWKELIGAPFTFSPFGGPGGRRPQA